MENIKKHSTPKRDIRGSSSKVVLLVVENRAFVSTHYFRFISWLALFNKIYGLIFWQSGRCPIWMMRKNMLKQALKTECTHILFLDTDTYYDDLNVVDKLLTHDKDLVSGIYYNAEGVPCSYKKGKPYQGKGLEEVDVFAMGASLIKREVIEKIKYPTQNSKFKFDYDVEFCLKAKEAGYKIYQDFDLIAHHTLMADVKKDKVETSLLQL